MDLLNDSDRATIAQAVGRAEAATSGEIVCVIARRVSAYPEIPLAFAAAATLVIPPVALAIGLDPLALIHVAGGWTAGHSSALRTALAVTLGGYAAAQAVLFGLVAALVAIPAVRRVLTPGALKRRRVEAAALAQLGAAALAAGPSRAAVVIFASQDDRIVEVVASEAIHAKAGAATWDKAVAAALAALRRNAPAEGFVAAVEICGAALAEHFPAEGPDLNAVSDAPLEL